MKEEKKLRPGRSPRERASSLRSLQPLLMSRVSRLSETNERTGLHGLCRHLNVLLASWCRAVTVWLFFPGEYFER